MNLLYVLILIGVFSQATSLQLSDTLPFSVITFGGWKWKNWIIATNNLNWFSTNKFNRGGALVFSHLKFDYGRQLPFNCEIFAFAGQWHISSKEKNKYVFLKPTSE